MSGPSGKNRGVLFSLRAANRAQLDRWKAAADRRGLTLNALARQLLDAASR